MRGADGDPHAIRTGVTAVFPHEGDPWREPVYAGTHILNGYGELIGINQITRVGRPDVAGRADVEPRDRQGVRRHGAMARRAATGRGAEEVMPVVSECDDSGLNDVLSFPLADEDVAAALDGAVDGRRVAKGCVGAGTGMQCFDFKGGIGTASRVLPADAGAYTVGALVLTNFGDRPDLRIDGVRVGEEITDLMPVEHTEGSCVVVVATDAPLLPHQLRRVAQRAGMGLARTGSYASNGSGEQMLAFSTANRIPVRADRRRSWTCAPWPTRVRAEPWLLGRAVRGDGRGHRGGRRERARSRPRPPWDATGTRCTRCRSTACSRSWSVRAGSSRVAEAPRSRRRTGTDRRAPRRTAAGRR